MSTPLHDVMNTSDHLLDISSEHESLTHHPSLISAYESELHFDESSLQHETEPYHSQVEDNADLNETSGENFTSQSDKGVNSKPTLEDVRMFSSSPRVDAGEDILVESDDEEGDNPYSSYQQFHRDLSSHEDPKSELLEFELLEQDNTDTATPEIDLGPMLDQLLLTVNDDIGSYDSLKEYLRRTSQPSNTSDGSTSNTPADQVLSDAYEMGIGAHKSRRDKWVDNSTGDVTSSSNATKPKPASSSPSRIPRASTGDSPSRSRPMTPSRTTSRSRSMTPTGIPSLRSKSRTTPRERGRGQITPSQQLRSPSPQLRRPATIAVLSPSAKRRSPGNVPASGRRSVSADTSAPKSALRGSGIPSPVADANPTTRRRNVSASQIPRSRPLTPSSSLRSFDRQSSEEPRSEISEVTSTSRPPSRLPRKSKSGSALYTQLASRASVEPRKLQTSSSKPSRLPSARPSVTSATELTSQDEQSADLDLSSGDEARANPSDPLMSNTFLTQPHNSLHFRNPPSSDTQPYSTHADTHEQFTSNDERSTTEAPHTPKLKTTKITKTTYDYEEVETTKTTTRILAQSSPLNSQPDKPDLVKGDKPKPASNRSKSQGSRLKRVEQLMDRRALSADRKDSPSQFGEAKALNDAIRMLEARETKDSKSPAEKSSWSPSMPDDMGDNSRPSSTWTSLAEYNNADDTKANNTIVRVDERKSDRSPVQKKKGEEMPRTNHTHLPGAVNHAHYALPTTSYLAKLEDGVDSSSSEMPQQSPRRRKHEASAARRLPSESAPQDNETESDELVKQLQTDFDDLLSKYAMAEVTIDQLRLGAKLNLYSDPAQPSQATVVQPGTARSATTLSMPQKGQVSLNSSLQSANMGYNFPGSSPHQAAEAGILTAANHKPLSDSQRSLKDNVIHLQDQVGSFIAGVSGEGRLLNLKPEIHHQLYEALEQSQDTLHHQLNEEKRLDPEFDEDNQLAGQLHQIRMSMDEHIDKLPQIPQPSSLPTNRYNSDDEGRSQTPSSVNTGHSGSTSTQRPRKSGDRRSKKASSRKTTSRGSKNSYSERSSSPGEDIMTDDETIRPRSHRLPMPPSKVLHGAASASSNAGSDHGQPRVKSRTRIQGSSDSGFIGSEEGKSPNTPTDRHLSGLPTIQSQAENSGLDSPRALTPDLSESRTAEWALRHKVPIEDGADPVLPEPKKRTQSRSSRKSVRSDRSVQSSIRSEALRSIQSEIERLRDDFNSQQGMLSPERHSPNIPKHSYGSPMKATYQLPAGYQQPSAPKPQASNKADVRNSDLDLSEVEGGRGYTPVPPPKRGPKSHEYYPSTDEDPRVPLPHSDSKSRRGQQPFLGKEYLDQSPPQQSPQRITDSDYQPSESSRRHPDNRPIKPEYLDPEAANHRQSSRPKHSDTESNVQAEEMAAREYSRRHRGEPREYPSSSGDRRAGKEYSPSRSPASPYDYDRRAPHRAEDYHDRNQPRERPSSGRSHKSYYDDSDYRRPDPRGQRSGYRGDMSPISERPFEEPEREYYRKYKSPLRRSRSFQDLGAPRGYSQTMDELNTRDLNQTTLPVDSTVHTNQTKSPHIAPPNAYSTPYHQPTHMGQSQPPTQQISQPYQPMHQTNQPYQPMQQTNQPYQPMQQTNQPYQSTQQTNQPYHPMQQTHPPLGNPVQSYMPTQTYSANQQPYQQTIQQPVPIQSPVYQQQTVAVPQQQTVVVPTVTVRPGTTTYHTCTSCAGRGILTATHHCPLCGSQETRLANQLSTLHVTNQPTVATVTSQSTPLVVANQEAPVVIPVSNENKAYLTQQTAGGYLTQGVDVVETVESKAAVAVPVIESSPLGARYYVRDYRAIHSDAEPSRSRSSRHRRERRRDNKTAVSMDDLETSLRDARRSAESLKRLSRGMREDLQDELTRSLHRRSLNSSWLL